MLPAAGFLLALAAVPSPQGRDGFDLVDLGTRLEEITGMTEVPLNGGMPLVVGSSPAGQDRHALLWQDGQLGDLHRYLHNDPTRPNVESFATGVGTGVVGYKTFGPRLDEAGFWFVNGEMRDFSRHPPYHRCRATAINSQGELAVAFRLGTPTEVWRKMPQALWTGDWPPAERGWLPLPRLSSSGSTVVHDLLTDGTGNHAWFAGQATNVQSTPRAVFGDAREGTIRDLGTLAGMDPELRSVAWALNDRKQIVGQAHAAWGEPLEHKLRPCLWEPLRSVNLSEVPGCWPSHFTYYEPRELVDSSGVARDVNNLGWVVGVTGDGPRDRDILRRGVLWHIGRPGELTPAQMRRIDLAAIVPPDAWFAAVLDAFCINDGGVVAIQAGRAHDRKVHAVLLVPRSTSVAPPASPGRVQIAVHEADYGAQSASTQAPSRDPPFPLGLDVVWEDRSDGELWFEIERRFDTDPWELVNAAPAAATRLHDGEVAQRESWHFRHGRSVRTVSYRALAVSFAGASAPGDEATVPVPIR